MVQDTDFAYKGLGPRTAFTRTWNGGPTQPGMFGNNWSFAYESTLVKTCSGATVKKGSGQELTYVAELCPSSGALSYPVSAKCPSGNFDKLAYMLGDYWVYENKVTRLKYRYDPIPGSVDTYRLTSITDNNGNIQQISYNNDGTISRITDAAGRFTTFGYDANGHCTSMVVPDGRTATYTYDANGNMVGNTDLLRTAITYIYDAENYITSMAYAGKTTSFTYSTDDGPKRLASVTDANGNTKTYAFLTNGSTRVTDALGTRIAYTNQDGLTTSMANWDTGQTVSWAYLNGLPTSITYANGSTTLMQYDGSGNLTKLTDPLGNMTTYAYDGNCNLLSEIDPTQQTSGKAWTYAYDAKGNLKKAASPLGKETNCTYDAKGQMTELTDGNNNRTALSYDSFGNVKTVADANGKTAILGYDTFGFNRVSMKDRLGRETQFSYDNNGRVIGIAHPDGSSRTLTYDACAMTSLTDENGKSSSFDRNGFLSITRIIDPLGKNINMAYDANNNLVSMANALSQTVAMTYDRAGRNIRITKPSGSTIEKTYDGNGNLTALNDERTNSTGFSYDSNNRLLSAQDPLNRAVTFTRDKLGRTIQKTSADGSSISYTYDDDGRPANKTYSKGGSITYNYDAASNLTSAIDPSGATSFTYDNLSRTVSIGYPDSRSLSYTYDDAGNTLSVTYPGGLVASYTYNNRNRVSSLSASWGSGSSLSVTYTYDGAGNRLKEERSNGTLTDYAYDGNNRITKIEHKKGSDLFAGMDYKRDAAGKITEETLTLPVSHSPSNESVSGTYNEANQASTWDSKNYSYEIKGNLTTIGGSSSFSAVYDQGNRPTSITQNGFTTTYTYNGLGSRTRAASVTQTRNFHHDAAGKLMFETDNSGAVTVWYIYTKGLLSAMVTSSGGKYFYHFDKTGSTVVLTDGDANIASAYGYEPFGKVSNKTGTVTNPFTYVGALGVMDEGNGLYFMRNRYYDANTGKFLQKDPIGFAGGINLYRYVGNNPVNRVDPLGLAGLGVMSEFVEAAGCPPGSTCAQFLQEGFEVTRTMANKAPGKLGDLVYKLKSLTIDAGATASRATETFNTWIRPYMGRVAAAGSEVSTLGCFVAVYGTLSAWEGVAGALSLAGWMSGSEDLSLAGSAAAEAPIDAMEYAVDAVKAGANAASRFTSNAYYFGVGLKESIFGSSQDEE